jgi:hypothetical protein
MLRLALTVLILAGCSRPRERQLPSVPRLGDAGGTIDAGTRLDASAPSCGECELGERCIDGACTIVSSATVRVSAHSSQQMDGSIDWTYGDLLACFNEPSGEATNWPPASIASEGPCQVHVYHADDEWTFETRGVRRNAGAVLITGGSPSPISLELDPDVTRTCYRHGLSIPFPPIFTGGALSIRGSGGPDFPAFEGEVAVPDLLTLTTGVVARGLPLAVEWSGTNDPTAEVFFFVRGIVGTDSTDIQCRVPDTGSFTVSAALTSLLPSDAVAVFLRAEREIVVTVEPAGTEVSVILITTSGATRMMTYQP